MMFKVTGRRHPFFLRTVRALLVSAPSRRIVRVRMPLASFPGVLVELIGLRHVEKPAGLYSE